jgi:hypothetical protein
MDYFYGEKCERDGMCQFQLLGDCEECVGYSPYMYIEGCDQGEGLVLCSECKLKDPPCLGGEDPFA